MKKFRMMPSATACLALGVLMTVGHSAQAQTAGSLLGRVGVTQIAPDVSSGELTYAPPNARVDVKSATQIGGGITYMVTDNVAVDLPLALPFKHKMVGDGSALAGQTIGSVKALPATLLAQYRFMEPNAAFRPYVGLGLTYAKFFKPHTESNLALTGGVITKVDSKLVPTVQLGVTMPVQDRWFIDATVLKTFLKTTTHLRPLSGVPAERTIETKLDPWSYHIAVGYRFW